MTKIERMDQFRRRGLTWFFWAFSVVFGLWIGLGQILSIIRPKLKGFSEIRHEAFERYLKFSNSIEPFVAVIVLIGCIIVFIAVISWSSYRKKLAKDSSVEMAVRDERIDYFWRLASRRALAVIIVFQFIIWAANDIFYLAFERYYIESTLLITVYLLVIVSIGTFLRLEKRDRMPEESSIDAMSPYGYKFSGIERKLIPNAVPLLGIYLSWHLAFIFTRIFFLATGFFSFSVADEITIIQRYEIFKMAQIFWLAVLGGMAWFFLRKKNRFITEDEGVHLKWLNACRLSFKSVLYLSVISVSAYFLFQIALGFVKNMKIHMFLTNISILYLYTVGYHFILFLAITVLLGSYIYYDRRDQGDDHASEK